MFLSVVLTMAVGTQQFQGMDLSLEIFPRVIGDALLTKDSRTTVLTRSHGSPVLLVGRIGVMNIQTSGVIVSAANADTTEFLQQPILLLRSALTLVSDGTLDGHVTVAKVVGALILLLILLPLLWISVRHRITPCLPSCHRRSRRLPEPRPSVRHLPIPLPSPRVPQR